MYQHNLITYKGKRLGLSRSSRFSHYGVLSCKVRAYWNFFVYWHKLSSGSRLYYLTKHPHYHVDYAKKKRYTIVRGIKK